MAKLIKRDQRPTDPDRVAEVDGDLAAGEGLQDGSEESGRRSAILDKQSLGARSEAVTIRDRAQAQADELLASARAEAQAIRTEAQSQADELKASARAEGLAAGKQEGSEQLVAAALRLGEQSRRLQDELTPQIVTLAMAVARRVLGRELEFQPEAVVQIVRQALSDKARQRREITLRVHPEDAGVIREQRPALVEMLSRTKEIAIQEDPEVARHGVVIETEAGIIDAQLEVQLAALEAALRQVEATE